MENNPPSPSGTASSRRELDDEHNLVPHPPSQTKSHSKSRRNNTLMSTLRTSNNAVDDAGDNVGNDSGLPTPPSTQTLDATQMPISPPPEETLRTRHSSVIPKSNIQFTPSLLASRTSNAATAKRKRQTSMTPSIQTIDLSRDDTPEVVQDTTASTNQAAEATPNPKPRKQSRHRSQALEFPTKATTQSPHAHNPNADFIPPFPVLSRKFLSSRRRSATPIPLYEPPAERFTPPREVLLTPLSHAPKVSKSSKRKSNPIRRRETKLFVKTEPPDIDLTIPLPPPSPTDDPLLLSGPPGEVSPKKTRAKLHDETVSAPRPSTNQRTTPSIASTSPVPSDDYVFILNPDQEVSTDFSIDASANTEPLPLFDLNAIPDSGGGWSDSDSDNNDQFDGSGEFTGRFKMMQVPTKADPPTSATKSRMDAWGRPVSPFPRMERETDTLFEEDEDEDVDIPDNDGELGSSLEDQEQVREDGSYQNGTERMSSVTPVPQSHSLPSSPVGGYDDQDMELETDDLYQDDHDRAASPPHEPTDTVPEALARELSIEEKEEEEEEELIDRALSHEPDHDESDDEKARYGQTVPPRVSEPNPPSDVLFFYDHRESMPPSSIRGSSVPHRSSSPEAAPLVQGADRDTEVEEADAHVTSANGDDSSEGESDSDDSSVIKITSSDPRAAAKAAAILKLHDYDCIPTVLLKKRRHSHSSLESFTRNARRRSTSSSGVKKGASPLRRRTTMGGVLGDKVIIPGSPVMTLPQLLQEAEVGLDRRKSLSKASSVSRLSPLNVNVSPRAWARDDWKQLDACFTDIRLEIGSRRGAEGALADVEEVPLENVVDKFVAFMGGSSVHSMGSDWSRDNLLARARALQKKQRSGNVAPPTPTFRGTTPLTSLEHVPDFTPLPRRSWPKPKLPAPFASTPFDSMSDKSKVHAPLLAPRYGHLLEEAIAVGSETQESSAPPTIQEPSSSDNMTARPRTTVGKRVKGFFFSYLPTLSKAGQPPKIKPSQPGLPLPPLEAVAKPRGLVATPARPPIPKPPHPKELVQLNPAPAPQPSMIPRPSKPQRLVELHPVTPPQFAPPVDIPRPRRSSGASVKDLVKSFEDLENQQKFNLHRARSNSDLKAQDSDRPVWRP